MNAEQLRAHAQDRLRAASNNLTSLERQAEQDTKLGNWSISDVIALTQLQVDYAAGCLALAESS